MDALELVSEIEAELLKKFRPPDGTWYIVQTTAGILVQQFGQNGDLPTQSAFNY